MDAQDTTRATGGALAAGAAPDTAPAATAAPRAAWPGFRPALGRLLDWLLAPAPVGALLGLGFFLLVFGARTLDPARLDWLLAANDSSTHLLGWEFFRHDAWRFPLGHVASYGAPTGTNIGMTDSIPLVAIALKALSPLLPEPFQYQGLWIALSYALQGMLGALIAWRLSGDRRVSALAAALVVQNPVLLHRADPWAGTGHYTLLAHWLLLAGLHLYLAPRAAPRTGAWTALLAATALVHPYLWLMVFGLLAADAWAGWRARDPAAPRPRRRLAAHLLVPLAATAALWRAVGLIGGGDRAGSSGLSYFSMNLSAPLNPMGWSAYVRDRAVATPGQYEGFNYLGAGVILLGLLALYHLAGNGAWLRAKLRAHLPLVACFVAFLLLAASPQLTLDRATLVTVPLPQRVSEWLSIFRSSGRLFWTDGYLLFFAVLGVLVAQARRRSLVVALAAAVAIQAFDLGPRALRFANGRQAMHAWRTPLRAPLWAWLGAQGYAGVFLTPPRGSDLGWFGHWAASHRMTLNSFYGARGPTPEWEAAMARARRALGEGRRDPRLLYVLLDAEARRQACAGIQPEDRIFEADGLQVLVPDAARHAGWEGIAPTVCRPAP